MSCDKVYSTREFKKLLTSNGYQPMEDRGKGSHSIYINNTGNKITINKRINPMVARRLIKENNLR